MTTEEDLYKEMTSQEKYKGIPRRMDFERANRYLQDLKKVFNKVGIRLFLFYGTLVGAIRDKDFPWIDNDVDVGIFFEDADKLVLTCSLFKELDYYICFGPRIYDRYANGYIARKGYREKVDFYTLILNKDHRYFYRYRKENLENYIPYPKHFFENMKEIEFKGDKYFVPTPPEGFLDLLWGTWRVPRNGQWGIIKSINAPKGTIIPEV